MTKEQAFQNMSNLLDVAVKAGIFQKAQTVIELKQALDMLKPIPTLPEQLNNKILSHEKVN